MKLNYKIYVAIDDSGEKCATVADDPYTVAQIYGLCRPDGEELYFESDVRHLKGWCEENGLEYREVFMEADV